MHASNTVRQTVLVDGVPVTILVTPVKHDARVKGKPVEASVPTPAPEADAPSEDA